MQRLCAIDPPPEHLKPYPPHAYQWSAEQREDLAERLSKLTLAALRRRQDIIDAQLGNLYGKHGEQFEQAHDDLWASREITTRAVEIKCFGKD